MAAGLRRQLQGRRVCFLRQRRGPGKGSGDGGSLCGWQVVEGPEGWRAAQEYGRAESGGNEGGGRGPEAHQGPETTGSRWDGALLEEVPRFLGGRLCGELLRQSWPRRHCSDQVDEVRRRRKQRCRESSTGQVLCRLQVQGAGRAGAGTGASLPPKGCSAGGHGAASRTTPASLTSVPRDPYMDLNPNAGPDTMDLSQAVILTPEDSPRHQGLHAALSTVFAHVWQRPVATELHLSHAGRAALSWPAVSGA
mmetsp:Transcript_57045/g.101885  ORF Transcript_57045/g.101885 Transcript_57045/m.101885 type:complete len:251 (-) Transcript_57045:615-1367(-)